MTTAELSAGELEDPAEPGEGRSGDGAAVRKKPKRVLHFSDGVVEEYSSEEETGEDETVKVESRAVVDPRTLSWLPWAVWLAGATGGSVLAACDRAGEKLAWWLGITSPKYYYEIQEALRMKEAETERRKRQDAEMAGWTSSQDQQPTVLEEQPTVLEQQSTVLKSKEVSE